MSTSTEALPDSINGRLADFVRCRKEEIVRGWVARMQSDPLVHVETLSASQLRDHLPRFCDDLAATLRCYGSGDVVQRSCRDAARHGAERWRQGFSTAELLREIMHLRAIFIYHLRIFEDLHPDFGTAARLFANSEVHRFLDETAIEAMEHFLAAEKQARREAAGLQV